MPHFLIYFLYVETITIQGISLQISVHNNPSLKQSEVEISNTLLIDPQVDNLELAMRFSTDIKNGDTFYTDLNGMHVCDYLLKYPT